jgi:hypothetical protein
VIIYTLIPSLQGSSWRLQKHSFTFSIHSKYTHFTHSLHINMGGNENKNCDFI